MYLNCIEFTDTFSYISCPKGYKKHMRIVRVQLGDIGSMDKKSDLLFPDNADSNKHTPIHRITHTHIFIA